MGHDIEFKYFDKYVNLRVLIRASFMVFEPLKVHKIEIFFGFDFEICIISLLVM
jgi:hypothetical protein